MVGLGCLKITGRLEIIHRRRVYNTIIYISGGGRVAGKKNKIDRPMSHELSCYFRTTQCYCLLYYIHCKGMGVEGTFLAYIHIYCIMLGYRSYCVYNIIY